MEILDPEKNIFDIFIVDGDSYFRVAAEVVEAIFPGVHTIHGAENILDLLFDYIAKIHEIKVSCLCDTASLFFYC